MTDLSPQEKIDYIYNRLKKEEKKEKFNFAMKWGLRSIIAIFIGYMYFFGINMIVEKTTNSIMDNLKNTTSGATEKVSELYDSIKGGIGDTLNNF